MLLITLNILILLLVIIINAFSRNLSAVIGFTLALMNFIALEIVLGKITF